MFLLCRKNRSFVLPLHGIISNWLNDSTGKIIRSNFGEISHLGKNLLAQPWARLMAAHVLSYTSGENRPGWQPTFGAAAINHLYRHLFLRGS